MKVVFYEAVNTELRQKQKIFLRLDAEPQGKPGEDIAQCSQQGIEADGPLREVMCSWGKKTWTVWQVLKGKAQQATIVCECQHQGKNFSGA